MARARQVLAQRRAELAQRKDAGVTDPTIVMITIVVLVVLALAGMFYGRGFVEQARDTNAQSDLARLASAEEFYAASAASYTADQVVLQNGRVSFTGSTDVVMDIEAGPLGWVASATHSGSGNVFYRASGSSATYQVGPGATYKNVAELQAAHPAAVPAASGLDWADVAVTKTS